MAHFQLRTLLTLGRYFHFERIFTHSFKYLSKRKEIKPSLSETLYTFFRIIISQKDKKSQARVTIVQGGLPCTLQSSVYWRTIILCQICYFLLLLLFLFLFFVVVVVFGFFFGGVIICMCYFL